MARINALNAETQSGKTAELLGMVEKKLGRIPNMLATLAHSPAALESYLQFSAALSGASLNVKEREQIALRVGTLNECDYCLKAHSAIGKKVGLTEEQVSNSKTGAGSSAREKAVLDFASLLVENRGKVSDVEVESARKAGLSDAELLEIVAVVSLNIYTNYINHLADPAIDF